MSGGHNGYFANLPSRKSGTRAVVFVLQQSLPEKVYINAVSRSWRGLRKLYCANRWQIPLEEESILYQWYHYGIDGIPRWVLRHQ